MINLSEFKPKRKYLICCDSDGCAIDTMDIKHIHCFGPCMVQEWGLQEWEEPILVRWNEINLYSMTRGINRFKGLVMALKEINQRYTLIDGIDKLSVWAHETSELSERSLEQEMIKNRSDIFKKALTWSQNVNMRINQLSRHDKKAYAGVKEALASVYGKADIAIVSSANLDAVLEEWKDNGLLDYVDVVCAQNDGTKKRIIEELLNKGYKRANILMCGDAPGDYDAAIDNQIFFYPILVRQEKKSWNEFPDAFGRLVQDAYAGEYALRKIKDFKENLKG